MSVQAYLFNGYWWAFWEAAQGGAGGAGWPGYCMNGRLWRGGMLCGWVEAGCGVVGWGGAHTHCIWCFVLERQGWAHCAAPAPPLPCPTPV